jgi:hypothetical protein
VDKQSEEGGNVAPLRGARLAYEFAQLLIAWECPTKAERVADRAAQLVVGDLVDHLVERPLPSELHRMPPCAWEADVLPRVAVDALDMSR